MNQSPRLTQQTLSQLPDHVARPTYDRSAVTAGIVHVGVGGFHRSHQAWYTDQTAGRGRRQCLGHLRGRAL